MRSIRILSPVLLSLAVAACGGASSRGLESAHQPVVSRTNYVYDLSGSASAQEMNRLSDWFDSINIGYGDRIAVDDPEGSGVTREQVAAIAARHGLLLDNAAPITSGEIAPGEVRVVVSRASASVPGCPDWSGKGSARFSGGAMSNFGCATNSNLAAMVANPEDLVLGRQNGEPTDPYLSGKAVKAFRNRKASGDDGVATQSTRSGE